MKLGLSCICGLFFLLTACEQRVIPTQEAPLRTLKTHLVQATPVFEHRSFPSVLEPAELSVLSFEVEGTLGHLDLVAGQAVKSGQVIAQIKPASLEIRWQEARAGVRHARAEYDSAERALNRAQTLFKRGAVTQVTVDDAKTHKMATKARWEQARQTAALAKDGLTKTQLLAPYDGIVNALEVASYTTVSPGTPIVSMYEKSDFEVSISVAYDVAARLNVGDSAQIKLADLPGRLFQAQVTAVGLRADRVSAFPVRLKVLQPWPGLRAGMAVAVQFRLALAVEESLLIPLSALVTDESAFDIHTDGFSEKVAVFVYDVKTQTISKRYIEARATQGNMIVVKKGLVAGERVAAAGVAFLRDGQSVRLLDAEG